MRTTYSSDMARVLLLIARESHQGLSKFLEGPPDEVGPFAWIERWSTLMADELFRDMPHWHSVGGQCLEQIPFELHMAAVSIFSSVWYYEIMLRKARDRSAGDAIQWVEAWRALLNQVLDVAKADIEATTDLEAERAYKHDHCKVNRWRHLFNLLRFGH